ncbi:MAG: cob(I)yrinic acid a,c-diamide adenosyltransferase [Candidatus Cloacimonadota bacterium]|nr:MAG: cob(I)yrinic acid a,c-diamide adenosyltransferase [Candidatus Cloacimonadota bacterium]
MVHLYTGNGKGKTTSAFGLALRAVGAGKKVFIGQFIKGMTYSEVKLCNDKLPDIKTDLFGNECFLDRTPDEKDISNAKDGLIKIRDVLRSGKYQLVILDEVTIAVYYNLFSSQELLRILHEKNPETEVVLTGRYASPDLIEFADLVTEMREIKHYYAKGVLSRKGIEF